MPGRREESPAASLFDDGGVVGLRLIGEQRKAKAVLSAGLPMTAAGIAGELREDRLDLVEKADRPGLIVVADMDGDSGFDAAKLSDEFGLAIVNGRMSSPSTRAMFGSTGVNSTFGVMSTRLVCWWPVTTSRTRERAWSRTIVCVRLRSSRPRAGSTAGHRLSVPKPGKRGSSTKASVLPHIIRFSPKPMNQVGRLSSQGWPNGLAKSSPRWGKADRNRWLPLCLR